MGLGILGWIILGGLAGFVAHLIVGARNGVIGDIIVGIIGAFLGGFIFNLFGSAGVTGFNFYSFFVAVIGAVVLLYIWRAIQSRNA